MLISNFQGAFCFPVTVKNGVLEDLKIEKMYFNGSTKSVLYSKFAGGIVGDAEGPFIHGAEVQGLNFTFAEGSTVYIYPVHMSYMGMLMLGYREMATLATYGREGVRCCHWVTFHMDTFQIVATHEHRRDAVKFTESNPRYQNVLTWFYVYGDVGSVVGCPVWKIRDLKFRPHVFRKGNQNYVSVSPMDSMACAKICNMFGFEASDLEIVVGNEVCV